jgi:hypothetical protein
MGMQDGRRFGEDGNGYKTCVGVLNLRKHEYENVGNDKDLRPGLKICRSFGALIPALRFILASDF